MTIKGLSDISRVPRIGKVRLGIKELSQSGKEYPKAVDYFVFDPDDKSLAEEIKKVYGEKPKSITVLFISNNPDEVFPQHLKRYTYAGLTCKGDGESATEILFNKVDKGNGKTNYEKVGEKQVPCKCHYYEEDKCKPMAHLMFMLYDVPGIGMWQLDTSSFNSIININSKLKILQSLYGKVANIPVRLILKPITVTPQSTGVQKTVHVIDILIEKSPKEVMGSAAGKAPALETTEHKQLVGKPVDSPDETDSSYHFPGVQEPEMVQVEKDIPIVNNENGIAVDDTSDMERQAFKSETGDREDKDPYIIKINFLRSKLKWEGKDIQDLCLEEFKKMPRQLNDEECTRLINVLEGIANEKQPV